MNAGVAEAVEILLAVAAVDVFTSSNLPQGDVSNGWSSSPVTGIGCGRCEPQGALDFGPHLRSTAGISTGWPASVGSLSRPGRHQSHCGHHLSADPDLSYDSTHRRITDEKYTLRLGEQGHAGLDVTGPRSLRWGLVDLAGKARRGEWWEVSTDRAPDSGSEASSRASTANRGRIRPAST